MVSCIFPENFPDEIEKINQNLPGEIRLLAAKRTVPSFDCRNFCDCRTYTYTFPTFTLAPPKTMLSSYYRVNNELIDRCNELLSIYKGTHNFHNFTSGKLPSEQSSMRYIMEIDCSRPFLYEDMEFARITIKGQSFMLHQIRKMVGLVFAIMRGHGEESKIERSFFKEKQDIPIAPSLGLLLEHIHYDTYNRKYAGDGTREPLIWDEFNDQIEDFKNKFILKNIYKQEKKMYSMIKWLETLQLHANHMLNKSSDNADQMPIKEDHKEESVDSDKKDVNDDQNELKNEEKLNEELKLADNDEKLNKVEQSENLEAEDRLKSSNKT